MPWGWGFLKVPQDMLMCPKVWELLLKHELQSTLLLSSPARLPRAYPLPNSSYAHHLWAPRHIHRCRHISLWFTFLGLSPDLERIDRSVAEKVILGETHNDSLKIVPLFETQPKQPLIALKGEIKKHAHLSGCEIVLLLPDPLFLAVLLQVDRPPPHSL